MTDQPLSPAAQAVLDAFTGNDTIHGLHLMTPRLAAALRAAADQVVPATLFDRRYITEDKWDARDYVRAELLAIAAELEAQ
jgi:hypothetical protein